MTTITAAIRNKVKRIVYCSSMARYGHHDQVPYKEDYECRPQDPYGIAKKAGEDVLKNLCETHGVEYVIAVPHNRWGRAVDRWQWRPKKPEAAGTLFTTILDYARFMSAMLLKADNYKHLANPTQKLSSKYLEKMLKPQIEIDNQMAWSLGWGLKEHGKEWSFNPQPNDHAI